MLFFLFLTNSLVKRNGLKQEVGEFGYAGT